MANKEMTPVEVLALSKAVSVSMKDVARDLVSTGRHVGRVKLTVAYDLKVGADYEQEIVAKADPWTLLAVALSKLNGLTVEAIVREAILMPEEMAKGVKDMAAAAMATVKGTTVTQCKGKVTGSVTVATEAEV